MNLKSRLITGVRIPYNGETRLFFTEEEKHFILQDYFSSEKTKREIWEKYTGQPNEHGHLLRWMRQLGYSASISSRKPILASNKVDMPKKSQKENRSDSFENLQLKKRIEELEKQLKDAEMKALAYSTMIDIAEKELKIPIKKKFNTKPS
jgi:hypothetical protein